MKKLVLFDLDGTLLNTIADLNASVNVALSSLGYPACREEDCRQFVGNGIEKLLERALPVGEKTPENVQRMKAVFLPDYDAHNADLTTVYPGIKTLLKTISAQGIALAVLSNKYQSASEKLVRHYFPEETFVSIIGQRAGLPPKPCPAGVDEIVRRAGVSKTETLYVGDSEVDVQTAHNAEVSVCAVSWGFRGREILEAHSPDFIADTPLEVLTMIG